MALCSHMCQHRARLPPCVTTCCWVQLHHAQLGAGAAHLVKSAVVGLIGVEEQHRPGQAPDVGQQRKQQTQQAQAAAPSPAAALTMQVTASRTQYGACRVQTGDGQAYEARPARHPTPICDMSDIWELHHAEHHSADAPDHQHPSEEGWAQYSGLHP